MNGNMRILILDADVVNAQAIKQFLRRLGYVNAIHMPNGYDGVQALLSRKADFILCRLKLPVMDASEILQEMKVNVAIERVPFAIFDDRLSKDDVALLQEYGADGTLSLPFVQKDLAELLAKTWSRYIDKSSPDYFFEQARRLLASSKDADAEKIYLAMQAKGLAPERTMIGLARVAKKKNELKKALEIAEDTIQKYPEYVHAYQTYGEICLALDDKVSAMEALMHAIDLSPKNPFRYEVVANLLFEVELWTDAEELCDKALALGLDFPRLWALKGQALANLGKRKEAITIYLNLTRKHPKEAAFFNNLAACYKNEGNLDEAMIAYKKALDLQPSNTRIMFNLALLSVNKGNTDSAKSLLRKAVEIDPKYDKARAKLIELGGTAPAAPTAPTGAVGAPKPGAPKSTTTPSAAGQPPARQAPALPPQEQEKLQQLMAKMRAGSLTSQGTAVKMDETERQKILARTAAQVLPIYRAGSKKLRVSLGCIMTGYAQLISSISSNIVEVLMELTQAIETERHAVDLSESTAQVMISLQYQDEMTQILNGMYKSYVMLSEKGTQVTSADWQTVIKWFPVESHRKKLSAIAGTVLKSNRGDIRDQGLTPIESLELYTIGMLDELATAIQKSYDSLESAAEGLRKNASLPDDVINSFEGLSQHFVFLANRVTSLRKIVEIAVTNWLHVENSSTLAQVMLCFGDDLRGLYPMIEAIGETPEERDIVQKALVK
jgi:tetratricopeptide (TPR) repeat protein